MRHFIKLSVFPVIVLLLSMQASNAQTAEAQSCSLLNALISQGVKGGTRELKEMAAWMPESAKTQAAGLLGFVSHYTFTRGGLFLTGELGVLMKEHLIVMEAREHTPAYIRLQYESMGGVHRLTNIELDSPYKNMRRHGVFLQTPKIISCG